MCNFRWAKFNHARMKFVWQIRKKLFNCKRLIAYIKFWYSSLICVYISTLTFTLSISKLRYRCFWWVKLEFVSFGIDVVIQHRYRSDNIINIYATRNLRSDLKSTQKIAYFSHKLRPDRASGWFYKKISSRFLENFDEVQRIHRYRSRFSTNMWRIENVKSVLKST